MRWKMIKLGEVIKHRKGSIVIDDEEEYKLCRVQLHRRGVVLREVIKGAQIKTKKQQVCKAGDFLVAEMDAKVGGYGFVPEELEGAIVSSHYFLFELDHAKIRPGFLEVVSQLQILQDQIKAVGSTNYAAIRPANVLNWELPITDIQGQTQIETLYQASRAKADLISSECTHQLSLVKQLRQAFLREAMQGKLVAQDPQDELAAQLLAKIKVEKERLIGEKKIKKEKELPPIGVEEVPFEVPEGWVWCRLGEVCSKIGSGSTPKGSNYSKNGYPFFRSQNVHNSGLLYDDITFINEEVQKQMIGTMVIADDVLLNITGGSLGRCALVPNDFKEGNVSQHVCIIRPIELNNQFLHRVVLSPFFQNFIFSSTTGAGREGLPKYNLELFPIPLPPLAEQHRIVAKLDELMRYCDALEASIQASREQNEGLLQQVLREALELGNGE